MQHVYAKIAITEEGEITLYALGGFVSEDDLSSAQLDALTNSFLNKEIVWNSSADDTTKIGWVRSENEYRLALVKVINEFISSLSESKANISKACKTVGKTRNQMLALKAKIPHFAIMWDDVYEAVTDEIESNAIDRAINGVEKGVYYKGDLCGTEVTYPESTAMFLLQGRRADVYKSKTEHTIKNGDNQNLKNLTDEELDQLIAARSVKDEQKTT